MTVFFSQLINGLSLGSIYALIALGYSMVYGIILLLNFAHGDVIMVGAYMSWFVMNQLGLGPVTAVCATIITCTLLGVVIEKVAYTPLRNAPRISLLITAIGVSFFLEYTAELVMGSGAKVIPSYYGNKTFMIGSVPLGLTSVITLVVTVLSMLVLTFLVQKTKLGKAMRAVSEILSQAESVGLNVPFLGGDGWDGLEGYATADQLKDSYFCANYAKGSSPEFEDAYKAEYGEDYPNGFAPLGYDAAKTVVYGVQAAEDAGLEAGTDEYKQAVNDAIASGTIEGITGTFTFDEHHDPVKKTAILTYVDGKPELKEMF